MHLSGIDYLLKTSHLFEPFPAAMIDSAFFDRMHCYIPGWEIPKMRPEYFTNNYGFISDYFSEFMREMRKIPQTDAYDKYFKLGRCLNQRDTIAVRKMVSGLVKLLYPDGKYSEEDIEEKDPAELVMKLSSLKAESVFERNPDIFKSLESDKAFILGADTVVYAGGKILGKPADKDEARDMIKLLSGSVHSVFTGFTILFEDGKKITDHAETKVFVYPMSDEEIED